MLQLRDPQRYGLTATQGLQFVARVFTTVADVYTAATDPSAKFQKRLWMAAFVDACYAMILDEGMLKGMLTNSPSTSSVEDLASTELMSIILNYKFRGGPIIIFWIGEAFPISVFCRVVGG